MSEKFEFSEHSQAQALEIKIEELKGRLRQVNPEILAEKTGSGISTTNQELIFTLFYFNDEIHVQYPDFVIWSKNKGDQSNFIQLVILYYFFTADGAGKTDKYINFAQLPGGNIYSKAFQGYSGNEIAKNVELNIQPLKKVCSHLNGKQSIDFDLSYVFSIFPKFDIKLVYWVGDDEFPSSCQLLFNETALNYMPIDGCAIIGSQLTKRIIKNLKKQE